MGSSAGRRVRVVFGATLVVGSLSGALILSQGPAGATTTPGVLHVAPGGSTAGGCTTTAHPCATLGYALSQAAATDTVQLAAGTYKEAKDPSGTSNVVTMPVTIEGVATHPTTVVITAAGQEFGLIVSAGTTVVKDVTIENAGRSGALVSPATTATAPATVANVAILTDHVVTNDKCATTTTLHTTDATTVCHTPTPESDYGEGLHLLSVSHSTIRGNVVSKNWGGILVTDELGPNFTNTIATNQVSTNVGDCGITLAGHNGTAVYTSGPTTGKPDPAAGGVYHNTIKGNTTNDNGAAGLLAATPFPGTGVYTNTFETNTADGNGLPGMTIHSHAPLQDTMGNKVLGNTFKDDALHGLTGAPGDSTATIAATTGVEVFAAAGPTDVAGTVITGNTISSVYYGIWLSPGVDHVATIQTNLISVTTGGTQVFSEPAAISRVSGSTADATAAAEFTRAFPYTKGICPPSRAAVLATTKEYQDALSSQFLAEDLTTGTLLTPTDALASVTATTLKKEGVTTVYLVGGPLAITTTVAKAIEGLTAYGCGGTSPTGKISVERIAGTTQYGTAEAVAEHVGVATVTTSFVGAYATSNATGGSGRYNDTAGKGSSAPSGGEPTAILASGQEFQDAQAASVVSYHTKLPLLLTPATTLSTTAVAAIKALGLKQVILMGGPLAITNTVEAALVAKTGVSVLRVAGKSYTDTARELARFEVAGATNGLGWTPGQRIMVARGNGFTDGLAGAVLENSHNTTTGAPTTARPLLLMESPTVVGTYLTTFLEVTGHTGIDGTAGKAVTALTVLGGSLAVSTASIAAMETDLSH